ncbi:heavy-metal-associated domain-containing protein [Micrococcus porci]|uniref:heavy-metal-associated domain-containing protein n=1 Tax=Micrococcus porci TaxID=2856555 RepID=UPI003CF707B2
MTTTTLKIAGMTCGHCVASVQEEIGELDGVTAVDVDLTAGGVSTATVTSESELDPVQLRAAVEDAGYTQVEG